MKHRTINGLLTVAMAFYGISFTGDGDAAEQAQLSLDDLRTFTDVFQQVRANFIEEVDDVTLLNAAIRGMIAELDPYSAFLESGQFHVSDDITRGRYGGIGVEVEVRDRRIFVSELSENGPASRAGVLVGDMITAVNDRPVRGRRLSESIDELRGEPGTQVTLRLKTPGMQPRGLTLNREHIMVPSVESRLLEGDYGYFHITHFHKETHHDFERAITEFQAGREAPLAGVILDLRSNLGGVLQAAVAVADGFLDEGLIVYTRGRYQATQQEFTAKPGQWTPGVPLVILVDRGTASSSEVLAGALQDHGRAVIIGEKTYGKGSIQSIFALRNGSGLRLTTALYFTPTGRSISGTGIVPDVRNEEPGETQTLDLALDLLKAAHGE